MKPSIACTVVSKSISLILATKLNFGPRSLEFTLHGLACAKYLPHSFVRIVRANLEIKGDGVNRNDCLSGEVLQSTSEKCLGKEESRDPEHRWNSIVNPVLDELHSVD